MYGEGLWVDGGSGVNATTFTELCFRGGLVFQAHRLVYHATLGLRVIPQKKKKLLNPNPDPAPRIANLKHVVDVVHLGLNHLLALQARQRPLVVLCLGS